MPLETKRTTYLSPDDDCEAALLAAVQAETGSIHLLVYAFTDRALIAILLAKHATGIPVGVVVDSTQAAGHTQRPLMQQLVDAGIPVTISRSPKGGILHQKVIILGVQALGALHPASAVVLGSYNMTGATAESQANTMIIDSDGALCDYFYRQYLELEAFGNAHCAQLTPTLNMQQQTPLS